MTDKTKKLLRNNQRNRCFYCSIDLILQTPYRLAHVGKFPNMETVDHIIPKSLIPDYILKWIWEFNFNFTVLACYECNKLKGSFIPKQWNNKIGPYEYSTLYGWIDTGKTKYTFAHNLIQGKVTW